MKPLFRFAKLLIPLSVLTWQPVLNAAETNAAPAAVPPGEFHLTSQPPAPPNPASRPAPTPAQQSNIARLMERRASLLKDVRSRAATNGGVVVVRSNQPLQARRDALLQKKTAGTLTPQEQRQLDQLEFLMNRHFATNALPVSPTSSAPAASEQKLPPR